MLRAIAQLLPGVKLEAVHETERKSYVDLKIRKTKKKNKNDGYREW